MENLFQEDVVSVSSSVVKPGGGPRSEVGGRSRLFKRFQFLSLDNDEGGEERKGFLSNLKRVSKETGGR